MKDYYIIQPYPIRSKNYESKGMIIPSGIVKKYNIDESTILILRYGESGIWLQCMNIEKIPANQSLETSDKQVSIAKGDD